MARRSPPSYNASNYLTATVPANLVHDAGGYGITVKNPGAASASNSLKFVVGPNPFGTTIISLSPSSALAGGPAVTLTVTGERFTQQLHRSLGRFPHPARHHLRQFHTVDRHHTRQSGRHRRL